MSARYTSIGKYLPGSVWLEIFSAIRICGDRGLVKGRGGGTVGGSGLLRIGGGALEFLSSVNYEISNNLDLRKANHDR